MTHALLLWLACVLAIGVVTWFGTRKQAMAFTAIAAVSIIIPLAALGYPTSRVPTGQLTVHGARVDVDKAIYVMVSTEDGEPRLLVLPYSEQSAQQLQAAQDSTADGEGTVVMSEGEDGSPGFAEEGAGGTSEPKPVEVPIL